MFFVLIISSAFHRVHGFTCSCEHDWRSDYHCTFVDQFVWTELDMLPIVGEHESGISRDEVKSLTGDDSVIRIFPNLIIDQFVNLERVNMDRIYMEEFDQPIFHCERLRVVVVDDNTIPHVPGGIFQNCRNLLMISLANNRIWTIDKDAFIGTDLEILSLENNKISALHPSTFAPVPNLFDFYMNSNLIEVVHVDTFRALQKLHILDLSNNKIKFWTKDHLPDQPELWKVNLAKNEIKTLSADVFVNAPILTTIGLGQNLLKEIPNFIGLEVLLTFDLGGGKIKHLSAEPFKNMKNLQTLLLNFNEIETVNFTFADNPDFLSALLTLDLSGNKLKRIPKGSIQLPVNVLNLNISSNQLESLEVDGFFPIEQLRWLSADNNLINKIERNFFNNVTEFTINLILNRCCNAFLRVNNSSDPIIESIIEECSSASTLKVGNLVIFLMILTKYV